MARVPEHHDRIARHIEFQNSPTDGQGADLGLGLGDHHADGRRAVRAGVAERLVIDAKQRRISVVDRRGPLGTPPVASVQQAA